MSEAASAEPATANYGTMEDAHPDIDENIEPIGIPADGQPKRSPFRIYTTFAALCLTPIPFPQLDLFAAALNQTIVSTTIPSITADLPGGAAGYTWIGGAYLLANAACGPIWARGSDIWGRKPAMLVALALFAAATTFIAASADMATLLAGRALQGAAADGLMQLVTITLSDLLSVRHRSLALSALGLVWVVAGTAGPVVGGALSQYATWRWCFWLTLPVCGVTFFVMAAFLDVHNPRTPLAEGLRALDWFGIVSMLAATLLLLLGLDLGGIVYPWGSPIIICMVVIGVCMIPVFLYVEKSMARFPLIHLAIFRDVSNVATIIVAFTHSISSFGTEYYLPLYFQAVKQNTPFQSGFLILPLIITCVVVDILSSAYMFKFGRYRELIWGGTALLTLGTGLYIAYDADTSTPAIIGFQIVHGLGMSSLFQTPLMALQSSVSQADTATATATMGFLRNLGMCLSTVVGGVVFQNSMASWRVRLAASGLDEAQLQALSGYEATAHVNLPQSLTDPVQRQTVIEAFAWSVRNMFIVYTCIAGVGLLASAFIKQRYMSKEHTETRTGVENLTDQRKAKAVSRAEGLGE
ncbi:MFS general substrate transporter [Apiospora rasikravindrae]|uniref:MFS general substrate transporter n=1 Tax=Apiospora rasikravindrae TaxID=990691 RepID=A0ABR1TFL1_9PEZI